VSTLPLARLFGFEVRVHVSWAIILAVIAVTVVSQVASVAPDSSPLVRWLVGVVVALAFLVSAIAHELGHALAARRAGASGSTVVVYFFGGAASPALGLSTPRDEIVAALAGPLVSLVIGIVLVGVAIVGVSMGADVARGIGETCLVIGVLNLVLGGVNLLPAFPLDGGRVARAVAWARTGDPILGLRSSARVGRWMGIGLAVLGVVLILTLDSIDGLMLALCGWFLVSTSRTIARTATIDDLLRDLLVADVMDRDVAGVPSAMTLDVFADQVLDRPGGSVPVLDGSDLVGVLGARDVARVRPSAWPTTRAGDLMTGTSELPSIEPSTPVHAARDQLHRTGLDGLPVFEAGRLAGIVTRRAIAQAVRDRDHAAAAGSAS
jgi:Zn-dependent protease/CBS domain-containing protein